MFPMEMKNTSFSTYLIHLLSANKTPEIGMQMLINKKHQLSNAKETQNIPMFITIGFI